MAHFFEPDILCHLMISTVERAYLFLFLCDVIFRSFSLLFFAINQRYGTFSYHTLHVRPSKDMWHSHSILFFSHLTFSHHHITIFCTWSMWWKSTKIKAIRTLPQLVLEKPFSFLFLIFVLQTCMIFQLNDSIRERLSDKIICVSDSIECPWN